MADGMLASGAVETQSVQLRPPGALNESTSEIVLCAREEELAGVLAEATRLGRRVTLIGGQRSFGQQFLPSDGGLGVDVGALERGVRVLEQKNDGRLVVRVGGGTRFEDLHAAFAEHRVRSVPTSDRVTVAGALAACTHGSSGYFADAVRGFRLLTPDGKFHECSPDAEGLARTLFEMVPGSFGALGVTTFIDLELWPISPQQLIGVSVPYAAERLEDGFFRSLEMVKDDPRFDEGMGGVIYKNRGRTIVLADELLAADHVADPKRQALLTDEDLEEHAFTQGLANRFPRIAEATVTKTYPQGILRWGPWYGCQFYQRGYDRAHEVLARRGLKYGLARALGVDPRVPVAHQAWFFPRKDLRTIVDVYFRVLDGYPGIERRVEQQDIVLLDPSPYPAHSLGQTRQDVGVLTASYSLAALRSDQRQRVLSFFSEVTERLYEAVPSTRVSLCKQIHVAPDLLRTMHRSWAMAIRALKGRVDPHDVLTSRHLEALLG